MTPAELEALARRVETEEPSVILNAVIELATTPHARALPGHPSMLAVGLRTRYPRPYTTSLDAAASLVGGRPYVLRRMPSGRNMATIPAGKNVVLGKTTNPPAAALTAAALRALATEARDDR